MSWSDRFKARCEPLRRIDPAIVALTVLAFAVASYRLGAKSLWLDEASSAEHARLGLTGLWKVVSGGDPYQGLYFVLLNPWAHLFGYSETSLRALTVLLGGLAVPVLVLLGKRLFGRTAGLVAGLLLAVSPFFVQYEQDARTYALVVLLVTLSSYFFVCELERPSRGTLVGFVLASTLAIYAHYLAAFVLLVQFLTLLAVKKRPALTREWLVAAGAIAILFAPEVVFAAHWGVGGVAWIPSPSLSDLVRLPSELTGGLSWTISGRPTSLILSSALLILGCYAVIRAIADRRRWPTGFVAAWFVVPVLLDFAISKLGRPLFLSSYLIVVLPAFLLLGAAGLVRLPGRAAGMIVLALLIVCSGVGLADWYRQPTWNEDFRGATRYIVGHWLPGDGIVYYPFYARFGFAYYHAPPGPTEPGSRFGSFAPPRLWLAMRLPGDGIVYYPSYERFGFAYHQAPAGTTEPAVARFGSRPPRLWVVMRVAPQRQGVIEQMFLGAYGPVVNTGAFRGLAVILYRATSTPSTSNILRPHGVIPSAGAACFKAAGAFVKGPEPAGRGTAVYVVTQDRAAMGFVKAPNTTIAARLQRIFARAGGHIKPLKNDPTAFGFYRGTLTSTDSGLLSKCTG